MAKHIKEHLNASFSYLSLTSSTPHGTWTPNTDIYETADTLVIKMEMAGVEKSDLEITLHERLLIVSGHRKDACRQRRCSFRQVEIDYGSFERHIVIPRTVDGNKAKARFRNGFLRIELPKAEHSEHSTVTVSIEHSEPHHA